MFIFNSNANTIFFKVKSYRTEREQVNITYEFTGFISRLLAMVQGNLRLRDQRVTPDTTI